MTTRNRPFSIQRSFLAILCLVGIASIAGGALAQGGDGTVAVVPSEDMWDCTNPQSFLDYPAGEVSAIGVSGGRIWIDLAAGPETPFSYAVVARIDYDGGSEKAMYQLHDTVQSTGYLDPTTGFPIPGTESQVVISGTLDAGITTSISYTPQISATVENLFEVSGGQIVGIAIDGQMPPIQPGDPNLYIQVNTFYLPTANDIRACGEYLVYFSPAAEVETVRADGIHDGLLCNSGVKPFAVPEGIDLTAAWVENDQAAQTYTFTLEFGRVTELTEPIAGGIEFYDPTGSLPELDPDWVFNNTGNLSINFAYLPPDGFELFASEVIDGSWTPITEIKHEVFVQGNRIVTVMDYGEVPETAGTWFATVTNFSICDEVGLGFDLLPELPVPPRHLPATATATPPRPATPTATATATALPRASATPTIVPGEPVEPEVPADDPNDWFGCGQIPLVVAVIGFIRYKTRFRKRTAPDAEKGSFGSDPPD